MLQKQNDSRLPLKEIFSGSILVILVIILFSLLLGIITELGWTGITKWAGSLYLITLYLAIVIGAILAGVKSKRMGWITGLGVGIFSSILTVVFAGIMGETINWGVFVLKALINGFIGVFGGIIGVNFSRD